VKPQYAAACFVVSSEPASALVEEEATLALSDPGMSCLPIDSSSHSIRCSSSRISWRSSSRSSTSRVTARLPIQWHRMAATPAFGPAAPARHAEASAVAQVAGGLGGGQVGRGPPPLFWPGRPVLPPPVWQTTRPAGLPSFSHLQESQDDRVDSPYRTG
jgi:hypothetical protein